MTKILITGASSYLGESLAHSLKNKYNITILEHKKLLEKYDDVSIIQGDLENISLWEESLSGMDIIIHLAGVTHAANVELYEKINSEGTRLLVENAKKYGVKQFIYISTRAIGENCGAYGESKKKAEEFIKNSGVPYTIMRVGEVYDENFQSKEGLGKLASQMKKRYLVTYLNDNKVTLAPIHRDDVKEAIIASIDNPLSLGKIYTLAGPENLTMKRVLERMSEYFKQKNILFPVPTIALHLFYFILGNLKLITGDQLSRLLCPKESLSENVLADLKIKPRRFLSSS